MQLLAWSMNNIYWALKDIGDWTCADNEEKLEKSLPPHVPLACDLWLSCFGSLLAQRVSQLHRWHREPARRLLNIWKSDWPWFSVRGKFKGKSPKFTGALELVIFFWDRCINVGWKNSFQPLERIPHDKKTKKFKLKGIRLPAKSAHEMNRTRRTQAVIRLSCLGFARFRAALVFRVGFLASSVCFV